MSGVKLKDRKLFYIGGVVRDELLGFRHKTSDIDITVVGDAIEYCKNLDMGEIIQINNPFGTVRMRIGDEIIDFASTRREVYDRSGHLPTVTDIGCSLKSDVKRRDFTINALAKSLYDGEIIDYIGGLNDLKEKKLRVLHDRSFIDDPTRIVRGLKFSVRFNFELDDHTKELQEDYLRNVNRDMSYKRLKQELVDTFNLNKQIIFDKFFEQKIYKLLTESELIKPELNIESLINKYPISAPWIVYLGNTDISVLDLTSREQKVITDYKNLKSTLCEFDDLNVYKTFKSCERESILLYGISGNLSVVEHYFDKLENIKLEISGDDLIKMGYEPNESFSRCFDFILKEKLSNSNLSKNEELGLAEEYYRNS